MPCGLLSRAIGAKNARKIVSIASTRKSFFGAADFAIGASIAKRRAPPVCAILFSRGFREFSPAPMPKRAKNNTEEAVTAPVRSEAAAPKWAVGSDEARSDHAEAEQPDNRRNFRSRRRARKVHARGLRAPAFAAGNGGAGRSRVPRKTSLDRRGRHRHGQNAGLSDPRDSQRAARGDFDGHKIAAGAALREGHSVSAKIFRARS